MSYRIDAHHPSINRFAADHHRLALLGLLCLVAVALLSACDDDPIRTPTAQLSNTPTPLAISTSTPVPSPTPQPTATPTLTATPQLTATPTPTATPTLTATPQLTATPTPTAIPQPTLTPTAIAKRSCNPTLAAPLTAEQEQALAAIPWAGDDQWARERLRQLLGASTTGFTALIQWDGDSRALLDQYTSIALCDEMAAMRILQMPFLEEYDARDRYVIDILRYMAQTDVDGLNEILNHPTFQNGITDGHAPHVGLLYLGRENPAGASALVTLPWVDDLLNSSPQMDPVSYKTHFDHFKNLVYVGRDSPQSFNELIGKSWVQDGRALLNAPWVESGCGRQQLDLLAGIYIMSRAYDEETALVLGMPMFDSIGRSEVSGLDIVSGLLTENFGRGFYSLLAHPVVADGITDDELATVALLELQMRAPEAAAALSALPWVEDGVSPSEEEGVLVLRKLALGMGSASTFNALLRKSWAQDAINPTEAESDRGAYGRKGAPS